MSDGPVRFDRSEALERLGDEDFDVLVVGGGITGAGVALDAAARGLRTALVEKDDFASGTSSASSKLVHGGLRYLEQGEVGLVFQSLAERQILLRNAPHRVHQQVFVIPLFGTGGVVDRTRARTYALGLWLYDLMGGFRIGRLHRKVSAEEVRRHLPTLRLDRLVAGFLYFDAAADDARLTLDIVRTAAVDHGAVAVNHAPVVALSKDASGRVTGARVAPEDAGGAPVEVRARVVVNATGVWADDVDHLDAARRRRLRPAKGVHVAVPTAVLPCDAAVVLPSPRDGRNVFVIPWDGSTYVGTTDTDYQGSLEDPGVTAGEVDYLLEAVNAAVDAPVTRADVTGTWSGLRPLLSTGSRWRRRPSERTADLSRRHQVTVWPSGLITVTGGKLTTYRKMAQDTVDAVARSLGRRDLRCPTKHLALRGAPDADRWALAEGAAGAGLAADVVGHLRRRYGAEAPDVMAVLAERPEWRRRLVPELPFLAGEVVYAARAEMARSVEDVLARRMRVAPFDARRAEAMAPAVAALLAAELGWSAERAGHETERAVASARARLAMLEAPEPSAPLVPGRS